MLRSTRSWLKSRALSSAQEWMLSHHSPSESLRAVKGTGSMPPRHPAKLRRASVRALVRTDANTSRRRWKARKPDVSDRRFLALPDLGERHLFGASTLTTASRQDDWCWKDRGRPIWVTHWSRFNIRKPTLRRRQRRQSQRPNQRCSCRRSPRAHPRVMNKGPPSCSVANGTKGPQYSSGYYFTQSSWHAPRTGEGPD